MGVYALCREAPPSHSGHGIQERLSSSENALRRGRRRGDALAPRGASEPPPTPCHLLRAARRCCMDFHGHWGVDAFPLGLDGFGGVLLEYGGDPQRAMGARPHGNAGFAPKPRGSFGALPRCGPIREREAENTMSEIK